MRRALETRHALATIWAPRRATAATASAKPPPARYSPNGDKVTGYVCKCNDGYGGNPYLTDGCQGILTQHVTRTLKRGVAAPFRVGQFSASAWMSIDIYVMSDQCEVFNF